MKKKGLSLPHREKTIGGPVSEYGIITHIQGYSLHDGPGIRTLVFLKGCPLICDWCCNPECQTPNIEVAFYKSECIRCGECLKLCKQKAINPDLELKSGFKINKELCDACGNCVRVCPKGALKFVGEVITVDQVIEKVKKDRYFYLTSKGGITISGGEPLYQFEFTRELIKRSYENNIDTAIETCGYAQWEYFEEILPYLNLILYDVKHMDAKQHKRRTGASNEIILDNLKKLSKSGVPIVIRLPLIPQFNLDESNIREIARYVSTLGNIREVNLMPFHQHGKDKYFRLSREYLLKDVSDMASHDKGREEIRLIRELIKSYGFHVTIGG